MWLRTGRRMPSTSKAWMDSATTFERLDQAPARHTTRFEQRGSALGHDIWEAGYRLRPSG